jgi:hypothetical protein
MKFNKKSIVFFSFLITILSLISILSTSCFLGTGATGDPVYDGVAADSLVTDNLDAPTGRTASYVIAASTGYASAAEEAIWKAQANEVLGATGNQVQINAALATKDVLLSPGTFSISGNIVLPRAGLSLKGSGGNGSNGTTTPTTKIIAAAGVTTMIEFGNTILGATLSDFYLDGNNIATDGIYMTGVTGICGYSTLNNISIFRCTTGLHLAETQTTVFNRLNCSYNAYGIKYEDTYNNYLVFNQPIIEFNTTCGIYASNNVNVPVSNIFNSPLVQYNVATGISFSIFRDLSIVDGYFEGNNTGSGANHYDIALNNITSGAKVNGCYFNSPLCRAAIIVTGYAISGLDIANNEVVLAATTYDLYLESSLCGTVSNNHFFNVYIINDIGGNLTLSNNKINGTLTIPANTQVVVTNNYLGTVSNSSKDAKFIDNYGYMEPGEKRSAHGILSLTGAYTSNGTGAITEHNQEMKPGINTLHVTSAGTFTYLPYNNFASAVAESGTATIAAGSPQTLAYGSVIDTGATTGTFTITQNCIAFAWHNPTINDIFITKVVINITTTGGTATSVIDCGIADNAMGLNRGMEFFDDLDANAADMNDSLVAGDAGTQTKWVLCQDSVSATDGWVVANILVEKANNLVGSYYIEYVGK